MEGNSEAESNSVGGEGHSEAESKSVGGEGHSEAESKSVGGEQHSESEGNGGGGVQHSESEGNGGGGVQHSDVEGNGGGGVQHSEVDGNGGGGVQHSDVEGNGGGGVQHSEVEGNGGGGVQHSEVDGNGGGGVQHSEVDGNGGGGVQHSDVEGNGGGGVQHSEVEGNGGGGVQHSEVDGNGGGEVQHSDVEKNDAKKKEEEIVTDEEKNSISVEDTEDYKLLLYQFPESDPDFLKEKLLSAMHSEHYDICALVTQLLSSQIPVADKISTAQNAHLERLMKGEVSSIEEYLRVYEDPEKYFLTDHAPGLPSELYRDHARTQLLNDFRRVKSTCIEAVLEMNGYKYASSWLALHRAVIEDQHAGLYLKNGGSVQYAASDGLVLVMPDEPCEDFYRELQYIKNREKILAYIQEKRNKRLTRFMDTEGGGEIKFCSMCYNGELLDDELVKCDQGHEFCAVCVRGSVEVGVGQGRANHTCLQDGCTAEYSLMALRGILRPATLSLQLKLLVQSQLTNSTIDNLFSCPYCSFYRVIDDPQNTVFSCLNPACQRQSCRLCKEDNHLPLRCGDIEQASERTMRTFIEKRMNESVLRKCHKCSKSIYKTFGCNLMVCQCGASMCYCCRIPIDSKEHFKISPACKPDPKKTVNEAHMEEMKEAAEQAKAEYLALHPESASAILRYDPLKNLTEERTHKKQRKE